MPARSSTAAAALGGLVLGALVACEEPGGRATLPYDAVGLAARALRSLEAADLDGDGLSDVIVGACAADDGSNAAVTVLPGREVEPLRRYVWRYQLPPQEELLGAAGVEFSSERQLAVVSVRAQPGALAGVVVVRQFSGDDIFAARPPRPALEAEVALPERLSPPYRVKAFSRDADRLALLLASPTTVDALLLDVTTLRLRVASHVTCPSGPRCQRPPEVQPAPNLTSFTILWPDRVEVRASTEAATVLAQRDWNSLAATFLGDRDRVAAVTGARRLCASADAAAEDAAPLCDQILDPAVALAPTLARYGALSKRGVLITAEPDGVFGFALTPASAQHALPLRPHAPTIAGALIAPVASLKPGDGQLVLASPGGELSCAQLDEAGVAWIDCP
jgi:hypothetical protein